MKKLAVIIVVLLLAVWVSAATVVPFSGITSVKLKGGINSAVYGDAATGAYTCYPGNIKITVGALDYWPALEWLFDPFAENSVWQTMAGTLAPGALIFDYTASVTLAGANVNDAVTGDPWEADITALFTQMVADGNPSQKPYVFCFMIQNDSIDNSGKIELESNEANTPYSELIGIEVTDVNGIHLFKYKKEGGAPDDNLCDRIQYTGAHAVFNGTDNPTFTIGGHMGNLSQTTGNYAGTHEDRCGFFFHRGLAVNLGWSDSLYRDAVAVESEKVATLPSLSLQNLPNPFTGNTRIAYSLKSDGPMQLAVYDISGRLVQSLVHGIQTAGTHQILWNSGKAPRGVYMLRLVNGAKTLNRKMILM